MRKTKEEANKTREEIIEAAAHLFETVGFEKTTMEEIARKAEVTRGAIYWHFKNKADVLKEFIDRENDRVAELVSEALGSDDSSFGKLKNMIFSVVDNFYDNRRFRQFIKITWYKLSSDVFENLLAEKSVFVQNFLALMEQLLLESKEEKEVEDSLDAKQGSYHLSCLINGFYRLYFVSSPSKNAKKRTIDLFESVFASMKNKQI